MPTVADLEAKYFPLDPAVVPHTQDTEVIAHVDGVEYFPALAAAIERTTGPGDIIYIANWVFQPDTRLVVPDPALPVTLPSIMDLLARKLTAEVDVKIVLWAGRNQLPSGATEITDIFRWTPDIYKGVVQTNLAAAKTLREYTDSSGSNPFEFRVLLDWSGDSRGSRHAKYVVVYNKNLAEMRAFVGGIDIAKDRRATHAHNYEPLDPITADIWHDAGVELTGGAATEVWDDFRTRWNETSSLRPSRYISTGGPKKLFNPPQPLLQRIVTPAPILFPTIAPTKSVRIVRSYADKKDTWDDLPWETASLAAGLQQILAVYTKAINSATRYIYVEDQASNDDALDGTPHGHLYRLLEDAMVRNPSLKVVFVTRGDGPDYAFGSELLTDVGNGHTTGLASRPNFAMFRVEGVYVHSKVVLIDDEFAAIGSANFYDRSMDGIDTELTAAIVDNGNWVRDFRVRLMAEHFGVDAIDLAVRSVFEDVDAAFGMFGLGTQPSRGFPVLHSRLWRVRDVVPSILMI